MADDAPSNLIQIGPKGGAKKDGFNLVTEKVVSVSPDTKQIEVELLAYDGKTVILEVAEEAVQDLQKIKPGDGATIRVVEEGGKRVAKAFKIRSKDPNAAKADAIRSLAEDRGIDLESSYAYSDSSTDLPMLRTVGHPVAVNPDRELRKEAETQGWDIRNFGRPVRLRTRIVQTAAHPRTRVAAGLVAASAAAAIVLWLIVRSRMSGRRSTVA